MTKNRDDMAARLESLRLKHLGLKDTIARLDKEAAPNMLKIQRLKRHKLALKDQIERLRSGEIPDIIA